MFPNATFHVIICIFAYVSGAFFFLSFLFSHLSMACNHITTASPSTSMLITFFSSLLLFTSQVKLVKWRNVCPDFLVRTLEIRQDTIVRTVIQFHYGSWPDHGVPAAVTPILELVRLMRDVQATETRAILVHCSAGCGRTGTICSIDYVWALLRAGKLDADFSLYKIIYEMRKQRIAMVQTLEQYMLCYKAVAALFEQQLKIIDAHTYENLDEDGEPLFLRSLSMQSNSSSSDLLVNSEDDDPSGQTSVKTHHSNAATASSNSGCWSNPSSRLDKNSIDSGIIIVNTGGGGSSSLSQGMQRDHKQIGEPVRLAGDEDQGEEEAGKKQEEEGHRQGKQQVHRLHERLPHANLDGGSGGDCLRIRRAPSLDSLMSCSAATAAAASAANCQLLHHHRQLSHPHHFPPSPHHHHHAAAAAPAADGLVRPEKLVGKATVIRRSSIAKLKAMFETLSTGEDNGNQNSSSCSSHHHQQQHHQRDHASRRIRLQRSQSTREKGSCDNSQSSNNNITSHSNSCKIFAAAHSYQRQRSAAAVTGLISPMDISHEAAAVAAQAFSLKLGSDQDQREQEEEEEGEGEEAEEENEDEGQGVNGQVASSRNFFSSNNISSQASTSSSPCTDQSVSDPSSECMDQAVMAPSATKSPGHQHRESQQPGEKDCLTIKETGAVPKKSSLKVSKSGRSSGSSGSKSSAPPKPPRTYQYGSAVSDKERGRMIARFPITNASEMQQQHVQHQRTYLEERNSSIMQHQMQQMHQRNILNRSHLSAPILPNHHPHLGMHASQSQPQSHPSPQAVNMDLIHHHHSLQQHLHQQALAASAAAGMHPVPPVHHMSMGQQKPESIYQSLVPRQMLHRSGAVQMHPQYHHPHPHGHHQAQLHHIQQQHQQAQQIYGMIGMRREYHHLSVPSLFQPSQSLSLSLTPQPGILHPHHNPLQQHQQQPLPHLQQPLPPLKPVMPGSARITSMQRLSPAQISYLQQHQNPQQQQLLVQNQPSPAAGASSTPPSNCNPHAASNNNRMISNHHHQNNNNSNHNDHEASTPTYEDIYDVIPAALQKKRPILVEKETRPPVTYVRPQPNPQLLQSASSDAKDKEKERDKSAMKHHHSKNQSGSNKSTTSSSTGTAATTSSCIKLKSQSTSQLLVGEEGGGGGGGSNKSAKEKNKDSSSSSSGKKSFSLSIFFGSAGSKNKAGNKDASPRDPNQHNNNNNNDRKKKSHSLHSSVQNLSSQISAPSSASSGPTAGSGLSGEMKGREANNYLSVCACLHASPNGTLV